MTQLKDPLVTALLERCGVADRLAVLEAVVPDFTSVVERVASDPHQIRKLDVATAAALVSAADLSLLEDVVAVETRKTVLAAIGGCVARLTAGPAFDLDSSVRSMAVEGADDMDWLRFLRSVPATARADAYRAVGGFFGHGHQYSAARDGFVEDILSGRSGVPVTDAPSISSFMSCLSLWASGRERESSSSGSAITGPVMAALVELCETEAGLSDSSLCGLFSSSRLTHDAVEVARAAVGRARDAALTASDHLSEDDLAQLTARISAAPTSLSMVSWACLLATSTRNQAVRAALLGSLSDNPPREAMFRVSRLVTMPDWYAQDLGDDYRVEVLVRTPAHMVAVALIDAAVAGRSWFAGVAATVRERQPDALAAMAHCHVLERAAAVAPDLLPALAELAMCAPAPAITTSIVNGSALTTTIVSFVLGACAGDPARIRTLLALAPTWDGSFAELIEALPLLVGAVPSVA